MFAPQAPRRNRSLPKWLNHDFCPGANRYVYWLKEPVGWFVVALATSLLVGAFLSPLGWTVAAGLAAILLIGLGFPWLATRWLTCELHPIQSNLRELEHAELELTVRNRMPLPILGLMIEGYLTSPVDRDIDRCSGNAAEPVDIRSTSGAELPDIGLARVPALSIATYRLPIRPEYRGRYPKEPPRIACAFPFGIWTARRRIENDSKVTVHPLLIPILSELEFSGKRMSEIGFGERPTQHGDFLGVRDFRRGDSLKSIHWAQSARHDRFIVCERGGPEQQAVELQLSTDTDWSLSFSDTQDADQAAMEIRENLAWRVRIAGSLIDLLVARHLPFRLSIDGQVQSLPAGEAARQKALDRLADIPLDGRRSATSGIFARSAAPHRSVAGAVACRIRIDATDSHGTLLEPHLVSVSVGRARNGPRQLDSFQACVIDLDQDIAEQLNDLLMEAGRVNIPA